MTSTRPFPVPVPAPAPAPARVSVRPVRSSVARAVTARRRPAGRSCLGAVLAVALSLSVGTAAAQSPAQSSAGIYRHVMPDGKIVYSDRLHEGAGQSSRLIAPQIRAATPTADVGKAPVESKSPEAKVAEDVAARLRASKVATAKAAVREKAPAPVAAAPTASPEAPPDPALVQSLMGVLGKADLLKRFADTCSRTLPTSMDRYQDAAGGWLRRNGDTVGQANRIMTGGMRAEYAQVISDEIQRIGDREFTQVTAASMHQRIKWCDNGVEEIKAGKLDVFNNATLTRPLNAFGKT